MTGGDGPMTEEYLTVKQPMGPWDIWWNNQLYLTMSNKCLTDPAGLDIFHFCKTTMNFGLSGCRLIPNCRSVVFTASRPVAFLKSHLHSPCTCAESACRVTVVSGSPWSTMPGHYEPTTRRTKSRQGGHGNHGAHPLGGIDHTCLKKKR